MDYLLTTRTGIFPARSPSAPFDLKGSSLTPTPTIAVTFKTFSTDPAQPLMTGVQITDYPLQHGQGMHGSFGRANTFNFMAAIGPDFKKEFVDSAPISNADIAPTFAQILGFKMPARGALLGRTIQEALAGGPTAIPFRRRVAVSKKAGSGARTILMYQQAGKQVYFDQACFPAVEKVCQ